MVGAGDGRLALTDPSELQRSVGRQMRHLASSSHQHPSNHPSIFPSFIPYFHPTSRPSIQLRGCRQTARPVKPDVSFLKSTSRQRQRLKWVLLTRSLSKPRTDRTGNRSRLIWQPRPQPVTSHLSPVTSRLPRGASCRPLSRARSTTDPQRSLPPPGPARKSESWIRPRISYKGKRGWGWGRGRGTAAVLVTVGRNSCVARRGAAEFVDLVLFGFLRFHGVDCDPESRSLTKIQSTRASCKIFQFDDCSMCTLGSECGRTQCAGSQPSLSTLEVSANLAPEATSRDTESHLLRPLP